MSANVAQVQTLTARAADQPDQPYGPSPTGPTRYRTTERPRRGAEDGRERARDISATGREHPLPERTEPQGGLMRIRSIKPEFWRSDDVSALSREHRLLFLGLWSYVDDNGVGVDDYRQIAADLFALDEDQMEVRQFVRDGLARLSRQSLIARYVVGGKAYLVVTGWAHQRIDKPAKPRYPQPPADCSPPPTSDDDPDRHFPTSSSRDPRETLAPGTEEQGNRGTEEETDLLTADAASARDLGHRAPRSGLGGPAPAAATDGLPGELVLVHSPDPEPRPARDPVDPVGFEAFWKACPRKIGKGKARSEYAKIVKRGVSPERLRQGMEMHARTHALARTEQQYIPYPATWLHQCRWEDEHVAPEPEVENRGMGPGTSARKVANVMDAVERVEQKRAAQ